jgi:hypothetical protein
VLPTILGGLMKQSSTPDGADQLNETLDQNDFDGGMLDNLGDLFGGSGASAGSGGGSDLLGGLAGDVSNLLMSQKDEVAKAMPAGMSGLLGLTSMGFQDMSAGSPTAAPRA